MPHIRLWTTADLPENGSVPDILEALAAKVSGFDTVASESVKAYHALIPVWSVGEGHPVGFAHCEVAILSGRPVELRKTIAEGTYAVLREVFAESLAANEVALTLEVREMDRDTYQK